MTGESNNQRNLLILVALFAVAVILVFVWMQRNESDDARRHPTEAAAPKPPTGELRPAEGMTPAAVRDRPSNDAVAARIVEPATPELPQTRRAPAPRQAATGGGAEALAEAEAAIRAGPPELSEDVRRRLEGPPPEMPPSVRAAIEAGPPPVPEEILRQLEGPPPEIPPDMAAALDAVLENGAPDRPAEIEKALEEAASRDR